ncbi:preprotein translocase subunit SecY [Pseudonocardia sp. MH-G8]|uniref:preprotein translocase subunit SecY n=1 Tax=Pseudonocardia sp. MH-G8 TaxID=1854588 RepID=UPI000BA049D1|nr:preprotein translocase subunit SecY [Pseudonocardia sp. MH-G8]OZM83942.1 preprotein translocase subunit SecY [Pseudonocardia sp. MH-G8]
MLSVVRSLFTAPDLRRKILLTLLVVAVARLGSAIPAPGVSFHNLQQCVQEVEGSGSPGVHALLDLLSGGALLRLSVFAVGVVPYITASIIVQLLTVVIPRFEQLKRDGRSGQNTLTQYTRYLTIALATLQATATVALAERGRLFSGCTLPVVPDTRALTVVTIVVVMVAGSALLMWLGELVTEKGIGNGISVLMLTSIAHRIPAEGQIVYESAGPLAFAGVCVFALAILASVVFVEQSQRRIPVQYAKRVVGRRMYGGTSTYLPLKLNQAGVVPVIFASSLLYVPSMITQVLGEDAGVIGRLVQTHLADPSGPLHIALYTALIVFFTYFYVGITFDPGERSEELKRFGGFVPGLRPGRPTARYLRHVLSRITLVGSLYLGVVAVLPSLFLGLTGGGGQNLPLGGTAVLILVGVALDTVKRVENQLMERSYEGFLR